MKRTKAMLGALFMLMCMNACYQSNDHSPSNDSDEVSTDTEPNVSVSCGNGIVEENEDCDDGNAENGDGCDDNCSYSCVSMSDCDDQDPCNGKNFCDNSTHQCIKGTRLDSGTQCGPSAFCRDGVCTTAT